MVNHGLFVKGDSTYDTFCIAKLSTSRGFTNGADVDVLYL